MQEERLQPTVDDKNKFKSDNIDLTIINQTMSTDQLLMNTSDSYQQQQHQQQQQQQQQQQVQQQQVQQQQQQQQQKQQQPPPPPQQQLLQQKQHKEHEVIDQNPQQDKELHFEVESQWSDDCLDQEEDAELLECSTPSETTAMNNMKTSTKQPFQTESKPSNMFVGEGVVQNIANIKISDVYTNKGASKRKNRLPRQSVQTSLLTKTKKDKATKKVKDKSKKKIAKGIILNLFEFTYLIYLCIYYPFF